MADSPALELRGITKRFGTLVANNAVDFELRRGEIHALLGENGAGKSTLMNVLYGLHQPDEGQILLDGEPVSIDSPRRAIGLGIGMVHQHFMLVPVMTVAENLVLGAEPRSGLLLDYKTAVARVRELSQKFGLAVDPEAKVEDIGVGTQQRVEILRALFRGAKVLVLDEPTAVLTAQEAQDLFGVLRTLTAAGTSVVFISHKLNEVLEIADRVTVLRRGEKIDTVPTKGATERSLARLMVGRDVLLRVEKADRSAGEPLLSLNGVSAVDDRGLPAVNDLSLEVCAGEIVGVAGVDANGQSELIETIMGLRSPESGTIMVDGHDVTHAGPRDTLNAGVSHIAEDRHRRGLVLEFDLAENLALRSYKNKPFSSRGFLSRCQDRRAGAEAAQGLRRPWRHARDARRVVERRQPAEGRDRARAHRRPARDHRRAADPRARRGRDRVRAPAPGRGARRGPRRAARLAGDGGDPVAFGSGAGDLRGTDRGRAAARVLRGGLRPLHDGRRSR